MLTVIEARQTILSSVRALTPAQLALEEALDCVLATDVVSPVNLPLWDNSAVDGYAVRVAELAGATENSPIHLRVIAEAPAGAAPVKLVDSSACVRIFTGAPVPEGADAVVMQEDTRLHHEGYVAVMESAEAGENIRRAGEDVAAGTAVLRAGTVLGPSQLAMAAAVGFDQILAHPRPRVGVLVTGSEIVEPGRPLAPGQIYDSNSHLVSALVRRAGCEPLGLGIADDTREDLQEKIDYGLSECDAVITVGGVSVGEHDLVKEVLAGLGCEQKFWQVAMKPGKPFLFGTRNQQVVFGLPGNPVSAAVTFLVLVRPALGKLRGVTDLDLPTVEAEAAEEFVNRGDRPHFMRARLEPQEGRWFVKPLPRQGSHVLSSMTGADCLVEVPVCATIPRGARVKALRFG